MLGVGHSFCKTGERQKTLGCDTQTMSQSVDPATTKVIGEEKKKQRFQMMISNRRPFNFVNGR